MRAVMGSSSVSSFARLIRGMVVGWVSARPLARCRSAETGLHTGDWADGGGRGAVHRLGAYRYRVGRSIGG